MSHASDQLTISFMIHNLHSPVPKEGGTGCSCGHTQTGYGFHLSQVLTDQMGVTVDWSKELSQEMGELVEDRLP